MRLYMECLSNETEASLYTGPIYKIENIGLKMRNLIHFCQASQAQSSCLATQRFLFSRLSGKPSSDRTKTNMIFGIFVGQGITDAVLIMQTSTLMRTRVGQYCAKSP